MLGLLGKIFGSEKTLEKSANAVGKMFYTKQEKADDAKEITELKAEHAKAMAGLFVNYQNATQGQNLTRRLLATGSLALYAKGKTIEVILILLNKTEMVELMQDANENNFYLTGLAFAFYFGNHFLNKTKKP